MNCEVRATKVLFDDPLYSPSPVRTFPNNSNEDELAILKSALVFALLGHILADSHQPATYVINCVVHLAGVEVRHYEMGRGSINALW